VFSFTRKLNNFWTNQFIPNNPTMRVIFAIFLAILLFQGRVSCRSTRRRRAERKRMEAAAAALKIHEENALRISCESIYVLMNIEKNTCPNINVWGPRFHMDSLVQYTNRCDPMCNVQIHIHEHSNVRDDVIGFSIMLVVFIIIKSTYDWCFGVV
jgi:hypothetical protein